MFHPNNLTEEQLARVEAAAMQFFTDSAGAGLTPHEAAPFLIHAAFLALANQMGTDAGVHAMKGMAYYMARHHLRRVAH